MFVSAAAAIRFREALATQRLDAVIAAAADLPRVGLDDALEILALLAESGDRRFERAAVRWLGRLLLETPATLRDVRFAVVLVERLPQGLATLHRLAQRTPRPERPASVSLDRSRGDRRPNEVAIDFNPALTRMLDPPARGRPRA